MEEDDEDFEGELSAPSGLPIPDEVQEDESGQAGIPLRSRWLIFPDQPLPAYGSKTAMAYLATMRSDPNRPLMALLCDPHLPPRIDMLDALRAFGLQGMLKTVDWGLVDWPGEQGRRFVVVMDRPAGNRVMASIEASQAPMNEDEITSGLLQPLLSTLKDFTSRGIAHRGIRPDNLFYTDAGRRTMVLGEGVTAPPGYDQPLVFETIESAMAHPTARGMGGSPNDLYALGVTTLFLMLGRNPAGSMSPADMLATKIEIGTYATLAGQYRLPLGMTEALRGMLSDDPKERWTVNDLDMWLSGRRLSPKQPKLAQRASRPFVFENVEYFNVRSLAHGFALHYESAAAVVRSKNLDSWLRRSLGSEPLAEQLQNAVNSTATHVTGRGAEDRLVSRAIMALDPMAPIRYRGFGVALDGIGSALAAAMEDRERRQLVAEVISSRLAIHWIATQAKPKPEEVREVQLLEKLPSLMDGVGIGYGVERCLYELNPLLHCMSPMCDRVHASDILQMLPAMELAAQRPDRQEAPLDRHIAAFITARARRTNEELLRALGAPDMAQRNIAILRMYAAIQEQMETPLMVPHLATWIAGLLQPVVDGYHQRRRRGRIAEKVSKAAKEGQLGHLLQALDDLPEQQADMNGFNRAAAEYREIDMTIRMMTADEDHRTEDSRLLGEQIATVVAGVLLSISTAVAVFVTFA